jgi:hypothetical protein
VSQGRDAIDGRPIQHNAVAPRGRYHAGASKRTLVRALLLMRLAQVFMLTARGKINKKGIVKFKVKLEYSVKGEKHSKNVRCAL